MHGRSGSHVQAQFRKREKNRSLRRHAPLYPAQCSKKLQKMILKVIFLTVIDHLMTNSSTETCFFPNAKTLTSNLIHTYLVVLYCEQKRQRWGVSFKKCSNNYLNKEKISWVCSEWVLYSLGTCFTLDNQQMTLRMQKWLLLLLLLLCLVNKTHKNGAFCRK